MTDRTFTATELHELLSGQGTAADKVHALHGMIIPILQKRPTLADMTAEEREACQWMQADVYDTEGEWVIRESPHSNAVQLVNRAGKCLTVAAKDVTPRPDLPRLEWPGDTSEPALRVLPVHRTETGYPNCATCDGGGCFDCTDPA